ncbi:hypothetical protein AN401_07140 [Zobellella denitrificans]|uniref:HTH cro/C1-type domain-containing protein n=2 Tax=Zobellella denitrificans TaxID=347534 RepID=A0A291HNK0_9GAMM|nr:hypothetical protein AN401_07140 [Zobellella denitrificans]
MLGDRLKEERERIGLTQPVFAELAGVKKRTVIDWEKGVSSPTALQLEALSKVGLDAQYVVTGARSVASLENAEQELLKLFRSAPLQVQHAVLGALTAGSSPAGTQPSIKVSGSGNRVAGKDYHEK